MPRTASPRRTACLVAALAIGLALPAFAGGSANDPALQSIGAALAAKDTLAAMQRADSTMRQLETRADSVATRQALELTKTFAASGSRSAVVELSRRARTLCERVDGPEGAPALAALDDLVEYLREAGAYTVEREWLEYALEVRHRILPASDPLLAGTASRLGFACYRLRDHAAAAAAWRLALTLLGTAEVPDDAAIVRTQKFLADAERLLGHYAAAESLLGTAVTRSEARLPRNAAHASLLNNLGALYWDEGRFDEAEKLYRQALRLSEADPKAPAGRVATAHLNLGVLLRDADRDLEAEPHLEQALARARVDIPATDARLVLFLNEEARLQLGMGRPGRATAFWEEALHVLDGLPVAQPIYRAEILYDLGRAHLHSGRLPRAEERLSEARRLQEDVLGPTHPELAMTLAALAETRARRYGSRDATAATLVTRALAILTQTPMAPDVEAEAYALRARIGRTRGQNTAARADLEHALEIVEEIRPRRGSVDASRASLMARYAGFYEDLIAWDHEAGLDEAALRCAERRRARVLRDQLAAARVDPSHDVPPEILAPLLQSERAARARLQRIQSELDEARATWTPSDREGLTAIRGLERDLAAALRDQQAIQGEIRLHSSSWLRTLRAPATELTTRRVQDALVSPETVLLEYAVGRRESFVFLIPPAPAPIVCRRLVVPADVARGLGAAAGALPESLLAALIGSGFEPVAAGDQLAERRVTGVAAVSPGETPANLAGAAAPAAVASPMHALWRILLPDAIEPRVRQAREVIVIPDGALHRLAFETLVTHESANAAERRYWLDEGPPVRYAHSITTLFEITARPDPHTQGARHLLTVSDPAFATATPEADSIAGGGASAAGAVRRTFPRLPATVRESAALRDAFRTDSVVCLQGSEATESNVKRELAGARIVHLATHSIVEEQSDALLAALLFAPEHERDGSTPAEDGWLHLFEIQDLDLECELAVLSTCDSEAGRAVRGEGTFALSRGFLAAGARRTVASLWPAADESTAELMTSFFRRIAAAEAGGGHPDYAALLRQAKLEVRQDPRWSAPFFWAPFVLVGVR